MLLNPNSFSRNTVNRNFNGDISDDDDDTDDDDNDFFEFDDDDNDDDDDETGQSVVSSPSSSFTSSARDVVVASRRQAAEKRLVLSPTLLRSRSWHYEHRSQHLRLKQDNLRTLLRAHKRNINRKGQMADVTSKPKDNSNKPKRTKEKGVGVMKEGHVKGNNADDDDDEYKQTKQLLDLEWNKCLSDLTMKSSPHLWQGARCKDSSSRNGFETALGMCVDAVFLGGAAPKLKKKKKKKKKKIDSSSRSDPAKKLKPGNAAAASLVMASSDDRGGKRSAQQNKRSGGEEGESDEETDVSFVEELRTFLEELQADGSTRAVRLCLSAAVASSAATITADEQVTPKTSDGSLAMPQSSLSSSQPSLWDSLHELDWPSSSSSLLASLSSSSSSSSLSSSQPATSHAAAAALALVGGSVGCERLLLRLWRMHEPPSFNHFKSCFARIPTIPKPRRNDNNNMYATTTVLVAAGTSGRGGGAAGAVGKGGGGGGGGASRSGRRASLDNMAAAASVAVAGEDEGENKEEEDVEQAEQAETTSPHPFLDAFLNLEEDLPLVRHASSVLVWLRIVFEVFGQGSGGSKGAVSHQRLTRKSSKDGTVTHADVINMYAGIINSDGDDGDDDEEHEQRQKQEQERDQEGGQEQEQEHEGMVARLTEARNAFEAYAVAFNEVLPRIGGPASGVPFHECSANPFIAGPRCGKEAGAAGERVDLRFWLSPQEREEDKQGAVPLNAKSPIAYSLPNMTQLADGYDYECMCPLRLLGYLVDDIHNKLVEAKQDMFALQRSTTTTSTTTINTTSSNGGSSSSSSSLGNISPAETTMSPTVPPTTLDTDAAILERALPSYKRERDLLPLLMAWQQQSESYGRGGLKGYDMAAVERALVEGVFGGVGGGSGGGKYRQKVGGQRWQ
jgi:hypothetical protein